MNRANQKKLTERLIGSSTQVQQLREIVQHVAAMHLTVLITGESGTGKELVATLIHELGPRAGRQLVKVNCSALTETLLESELFGHERGAFTGAVASRKGKFESADGGTLLLDEIGDITPKTQVALLRVLESGELQRVGADGTVRADVRVVAATNVDLAHAVGRGRFREDLYYRLNVMSIHIPPLRERREDIVPMAESFLGQFRGDLGKEVRLTPEACDKLKKYHWPGNARELRNTLLRATAMLSDSQLTPDAIVFSPPGNGSADPSRSRFDPAELLAKPLHDTIAGFERQVLEAALAAADGRVKDAAARIRISRSVFYDKMKRFGLG